MYKRQEQKLRAGGYQVKDHMELETEFIKANITSPVLQEEILKENTPNLMADITGNMLKEKEADILTILALSLIHILHDPYLDASVIERLGCIAVDKKTLLQESDIVSLHGRIGPNDPPIIGREELKLMKPVSYLINTARAVLVDMPALEEALQNGSIMGAAIDVFPKEPLTKEDAVVQLDNCTLTNHRGGDTLDSYERSPELLLEQLQEAVQTGHTKYMI